MNKNVFVEMKNVYKTYAAIDALKDVSCAIKSGDRIAVIGKSGSGKSTLLHILAGLDNPTKGCVCFNFKEKEALRPKSIGFLPQQNSLFSSLSVIENIELPLLFCGYTPKNAYKKASEILNRMDLNIITNKMPSELSGGQSQRVAFARAVVMKPKLILADEPTGQLDHKSAKELFDFIDSYIPDESAVVITTHDPLIAKRMDKIWTMSYGRLEMEK
jgi:ABC-type lipoprotein export system ATPase subunit